MEAANLAMNMLKASNNPKVSNAKETPVDTNVNNTNATDPSLAVNAFGKLLANKIEAKSDLDLKALAEVKADDASAQSVAQNDSSSALSQTISQPIVAPVLQVIQASVTASQEQKKTESSDALNALEANQGRQQVATQSAGFAETVTDKNALAQAVTGEFKEFLAANEKTAANVKAFDLAGSPTTPNPTVTITTAVQSTSVGQTVLTIAQPVSSNDWSGGLGDKVVWMVSQQVQGADLKLNPPSLGPLDVKVSMADGQANLTFTTQHIPVRDAIEAATSRLREMLGESGINLGSVSVNVGQFSQQSQQQPQAPHFSQNESFDDRFIQDGSVSIMSSMISRVGRGAVDLFA